MSDADITDLAEQPVFEDIGTASFSFAFELRPDDEDRQAIRLEKVAETFGGELREALLGPFSSYLDDVTTGPPGRHGRPLILLAAAPDVELAIELRRDPEWTYEAEGTRKRLHVPPDRRAHRLLLRDSFCAFKSGRIFYILSLALPEASPQPIDEYLIIQMQRQAMSPDADSGLSFDFADGGARTIPGLARMRLAQLVARKDDPLSGLHRILGDRKLLDSAEIAALGGADAICLRGLCIAIQDQHLTEAANHACRKFGHGQQPEADEGNGPGLVRRLVRSIISHEEKRDDPDLPIHNATEDRAMFALAGLSQGVADFGAQDPAELSDATCPANRAAGYILYAHPAFLLEVAPDWRTLVRCRDSIGTCPYLMLIWLAALHADLLVSEIEDGIDDMVYLHGETESFRSDPLADLQQALRGADHVLALSGERLLRENLERRLTLVGSALMHRSSTLFRYPKEKGDLAATLEVMGISARFERAQLLLEKIEDLVEDVITLRRSSADQRTNSLLLAISLLSLVSVTADIWEHPSVGFAEGFLATLAVVLALVAAARFALHRLQERRSRKLSQPNSRTN